MLNNLRVYSGSRPKSSLRRNFFGRMSRFGLQPHLYTCQHSLQPFHSVLQERPSGRLIESWRKEDIHAHEAPSPSSTARAETTTPAPPVWRLRSKSKFGLSPTLIRSHGGVFEVTVGDDLVFSKKKLGRFPATRRGRGRAPEASRLLISRDALPFPLPAPRRRPPRAGAENRAAAAAGAGPAAAARRRARHHRPPAGARRAPQRGGVRGDAGRADGRAAGPGDRRRLDRRHRLPWSRRWPRRSPG